jgi:hypothetical protein
MPYTLTLPSLDSFHMQVSPTSVLTLWLLSIFVISLLLVYRWLQPDPVEVRRFVYELISSRIPGDRFRREADLRKIIALSTFLLITFLLIKKQLMAANVKVAGYGVTDSNIDSLLVFTASLLGLGVFASKFKESSGTQQVEVTNPPNKPVPTAPTDASTLNPDNVK